MKNRYLLALLILAAPLLMASTCYEKTEVVGTPTAPDGCLPPASVSAVVSPRECVSGSQNVTCVADYSLAANEGDVVAWAFNGGTPPDSEAASGSVSWITQSGPPLTVTWRASRCTCDAQRDPDRSSCKSQNGTTTFTASL